MGGVYRDYAAARLLLHLEKFQPDLFRLEQVIIANYH
jgi:hypothetical protein